MKTLKGGCKPGVPAPPCTVERGGGFPALSHPAKMMETAGKLRDKIRARFSIFSNIGKGKGCATKSDEFRKNPKWPSTPPLIFRKSYRKFFIMVAHMQGGMRAR